MERESRTTSHKKFRLKQPEVVSRGVMMGISIKNFWNHLWAVKNLRILGKVLILISFLFFGAWHLSPAIAVGYKSTPFKDGEVLRYRIKWGFIRLGTIEISQRSVDSSFSPLYLVQLEAKSIKFKVVLHPDLPTNSNFILEQNKGREIVTIYRYDPLGRLILMESRENGSLVRRSSLYYEDPYFDVLGVIMMMRCLSASGLSVTLPTIISFGIKDTDLKFTDEIKEIKVAALDRPIRARHVEGKAHWKAWAGITGPFNGWFSDDEAAIPLKIYFKIFLGSVKLELEDVHRPDWVRAEKDPKHIPRIAKEVSIQ